jgi:protein-disulfide isomerase
VSALPWSAARVVVAAVVAGACAANTDGRSTTRDTARENDRTPSPPAAAAAPAGTRGQGAGDPRLARADSARIQGRPDAPLWIVEVSDFQCPYCGQWHAETYPAVKREYVDAGKVRFAYVNLPLDNHANAWPAAEAAMCAGEQGKFWAMHDALFHEQRRWSGVRDPSALFAELASQAGVDAARMRECVSSGVMRPLIQADRDRAVDAGVNSTPSFLIGGVRIAGAYPIADFRRVVDSVLAATGAPARRP